MVMIVAVQYEKNSLKASKERSPDLFRSIAASQSFIFVLFMASELGLQLQQS